MDFLSALPVGLVVLLIVALSVAFAFEFVNGFHDTANAVATVIYTHTLPPRVAVVWSGFFNFLGVLLSGIGVAYSIVYLLPVDLLIESSSGSGLAMVLSLLLAAVIWNVGTWYLALPASSSHSLIGAILGVGLMHGLLSGQPFGTGVNGSKAAEVGFSLLLSPMFGFCLAAVLLLLLKSCVHSDTLYKAPEGNKPPPLWIRAILIFTCTGVSFGHGSNDGQKGMGLIMLILIGIIPAYFALNPHHHQELIKRTSDASATLAEKLRDHPDASPNLIARLESIHQALENKTKYSELSEAERLKVRNILLQLRSDLRDLTPRLASLPSAEFRALNVEINFLKGPIEYVPLWVVMGVALALGCGTMIGWKRIVITVGEKIGKDHLTYAQGACAELTAMTTILVADYGGLPVSTTQVLSSAVAGTMTANGTGINSDTVKKIALAWFLTMPATMTLAALFFTISKVILG